MTLDPPSARLRGLAATAVIGSDRSGGDAKSPEKILSHAAFLGAQARAGYRARRCSGTVPDCPADSTPVAGAAAMATLIRLLAEPDAGLIEEWAGCAEARGRRVADPVVPLLLDWWCRQQRRQDVLFAVCGRRARWLAALNPAWRKPTAAAEIPENADEIWQTGTTPERVALLTAIRRCDAARGLACVRSTWGTDSADERRRFVEALSERLTMDDEPFLEAALDDSSKSVRRAAAAVLRTLPGSRLKARLNALAASIIVVEGKKGPPKKPPRVSLRPPRDFDKAWERDGLEEQAAGGSGQRAWWMRQVLGAADLSVWTDVTGLDPEAVLDAISGDDYFGDALDAMIRALAAGPGAAWAGAVAHRLLKGKKVEPGDLAAIVGSLSAADTRPVLLRAAAHERFGGPDRWRVLAMADHPWPREFSNAALKLLAKSSVSEPDAWRLADAVERVSRVVSPELAEAFAEIVLAMFPNEPSGGFKRSIDRVRLRADIHKEFAA